MFHACVQRFDGMDEKCLGRELNRALDAAKQIRFKNKIITMLILKIVF